MSAEIVHLAAIAARRAVADDLRAERQELFDEVVALVPKDRPLTVPVVVKAVMRIARIGAISKALEEIGQ